MIYYINQNAIVAKSAMPLPTPWFVYDQIMESNEFSRDDNVVYENGRIVALEKSDMYKELSGIKDAEKENEQLKIIVKKQQVVVDWYLNSFKVLDEERRALYASKQKDV